MDRWARLAVAIVLLAGTAGLCAHYGATYEDGWPYPTGEQLDADYDRYVGERALVFGEVRAVDADAETIRIRVMHSPGELTTTLTVYGVEKPVEPGGVVQIYGTLEPGETMEADGMVVINRDRGETLYTLVASLAGIAAAVAWVSRYWRVNVRELSIEPR